MPFTTTATDEQVVDRIAALLGTRESWSGADMLERIANLIGYVRPHPGDPNVLDYRAEFYAATGRDLDTVAPADARPSDD